MISGVFIPFYPLNLFLKNKNSVEFLITYLSRVTFLCCEVLLLFSRLFLLLSVLFMILWISLSLSFFFFLTCVTFLWASHPVDLVVKNPPASASDAGSIPGSERSPEVGSGNSLQCSFLGNLMDRGTWQAAYSLWGHKRVGHDLVTKTAMIK